MDLPQEIDSKFRLILLVAKRARQLQSGATALVQSAYKKPIKIALQEIQAGVLPFAIEDPSSENGDKVPKMKTSK
jgi:DNA-directed RNA polymerase subunit omega